MSDEISIPFVALTIGTSFGMYFAAIFATSRVAWLGTTKTTRFTPSSARARSLVAVRFGGRIAPGR
jgi:hypothetical protein